MRSVSSAFKRALVNDKRDYLVAVKITLTDGTALNLTEEQIWSGGLSIEDAVSADNIFQVGAAIINKATLTVNNIYGDFDSYDFTGAVVEPKVGLSGLDDGSTEYVNLGVYVVNEPEYNGDIITLTCYDYMYKLDQSYKEHVAYPATLGAIVSDICTRCGVTLSSTSTQFPHYDYVVDKAPSGDATTNRQVLSWAAQIAGCFARFDSVGQLELRWYDIAAINSAKAGLDGGEFDGSTPYSTGDSADGGSFNPWNDGANVDGGAFTDSNACHYIASSYRGQVSTDDIVITGVKVIKKVKTGGSAESYSEYLNGSAGYIIYITDNELIQGSHGQDIADWIGASLVGFAFRRGSISHPSDPTIEAGDVAMYWDRKGNRFSLVVSSTTFSVGKEQTTTSSAQTPKDNEATRYTEQERSYVEMREQMAEQSETFGEITDGLAEETESLREETSNLKRITDNLKTRIDNARGLYGTKVTDESGAGKIYFHDQPSLSDSNIVMLFSTAGFTVTSNYQASSPTWYGMTVDGDFISNIMSTIGINFDWGTGGTLTLGGQNNKNGQLTVLDSSGNAIGSWDKDGISIQDGAINMNGGRFAVDRSGNATAMSLTAYGSLICYESYTIS